MGGLCSRSRSPQLANPSNTRRSRRTEVWVRATPIARTRVFFKCKCDCEVWSAYHNSTPAPSETARTVQQLVPAFASAPRRLRSAGWRTMVSWYSRGAARPSLLRRAPWCIATPHRSSSFARCTAAHFGARPLGLAWFSHTSEQSLMRSRSDSWFLWRVSWIAIERYSKAASCWASRRMATT